MIKFLIILLIFPMVSAAQRPLPRFENDTLYTTTGFRIYKNQALEFGKGIRKEGVFKYINIKSGHGSSSLSGKKFTVKLLKNFGVSQINNSYIEMVGSVPFGNKKSFGVLMHIAIDSAIRFAEIIIPSEDSYLPGPLISTSQKNLPRFENDTVYTLNGLKICNGMEIRIGNGSGKKGTFRHISIEGGATHASLSKSSITIKELCCFGVNEFNIASVKIFAGITFKDGTHGVMNMRMAFDNAIAASELVLPDEYIKKE